MNTNNELNQFRKKPVVIGAVQWFKNGDHPLDYSKTHDGLDNGELRQFSPEERKANCWEGDVVRYYRHPDDSSERACQHCGKTMHVHGWIETMEGGHIVCPGDWIITGVQGEHYPCKPDIFAATYEPASAQAEPLTVTVDPDPRGVSVGVYQGSSCVYHGAHPIPTGATGEDDAPRYQWLTTVAQMKVLAAELTLAAETMGGDDDESAETELILSAAKPGTVQDDDGELNTAPVLIVHLAEYPEEGVYPIDPYDPTGGRIDSPAPAAGDALGDPALQKLFGEAITGALGFGAQGVNPPHAGHWLEPFWEMARSDATLANAPTILDHPLLREVLGYIEDAGPADVWGAAQAWMALRDAALSPTQPTEQGERDE